MVSGKTGQIDAAALVREVEVRERRVELGPTWLNVAEAGDPDGPPVLLLHGFPEFWLSWRHQIPALVEAGFRVIAPDLPGYRRSGKPQRLASYRGEALAQTFDALLDALGVEQARVVGHDWGGFVAWELATRYGYRVERLCVLNIPHPARMAEGLRTSQQLKKSWYMGAFQLPLLPEVALRSAGGKLIGKILAGTSRSGSFSAEELRAFEAAACEPGAVVGMLSYYRAAARYGLLAGYRPIGCPVQVIWGLKDTALGAELASPPPRLVPHVEVLRLPDATHWVQHDQPQTVNRLLLGFLEADRQALLDRDPAY